MEPAYLPSKKFLRVVGSVSIALFLVWLAQSTTKSAPVVPFVVTTDQKASWVATLNDIQSRQENRLPKPADQDTVGALLESAKTKNVTDSVGRSLLVNLSNAKSQGLGGDLPTQDQLVASALGQLQSVAIPSVLYQIEDLTVVPNSKENVHIYGNSVAVALSKHPRASMAETLNILGKTINNQGNDLARLTVVGAAYKALAKDFARAPVPVSLAANHLGIANSFLQMSDSFVHMQLLSSDPLRALAGLQVYNVAATDVQRMFINITQAFVKNDILFTRGEPGALFGSLLSGR